MQCTPRQSAALVVSCDGLASDEDMAALVAATGPLLAIRLLVSTCGSGCGGEEAGPHLVAIAAADPTVPPAERAAAAAVGAGVGVVDSGSAHLRGGTVALDGLDVVISGVADLAGGAAAGLVLISLSDLTASLGRTAARHAPDVRTLAVLGGSPSSPLPGSGWTREHTGDRWAPVSTGLTTTDHERRAAVPA